MTNKTLEEELAQNVEASIDEQASAPTPPPGALAQEPEPPKPTIAPRTMPHPYAELARILNLGYAQASSGKGKQRHAFGPVGFRAWDQQPILANARQIGPGGPAMQVMKKMQEATGMANNANYDGALAEALGAIVYAAAFYKLVEEMKSANNADPTPAE